MRILSAMVLALVLGLGGCATRQEAGLVTGATAGGALGHGITGGSFLGTLVGAFAGGAIGAEIGRYMDVQDRRRAAYALETQPIGEPYVWRNPDTGHRYSVTPERSFYGPRGPCREFSMLTRVDGQPAEVYGTACREPDGSWRAVQ